MRETYAEQIRTASDAAETVAHSEKEQVKGDISSRSWSQRLWHALARYPLPLVALALLLLSLALWLVGRAQFAQWTLLIIVVVGGIPLLWETLQHFLRREF